MFRKLAACLVLTLLWCLIGSAQAQPAQPALSFAIVPQQSATKLAELWGPLLSEVGRRAGVKLTFQTAPTIPAFEEKLARGDYDLAYMNPYHYVVFNKAAGYRAFAKEKDRKLKGIIVVRQDSPIKSLSELKGKTVAFPAPAAFAASILTQSEFARHDIPIQAKFVSSHDSVYRVVAAGLQDAGGGIERSFEALDPQVRRQLRVLAYTPQYTPHAFAASPRVPTATVTRVVQAMTSLASDEMGKQLLRPLAVDDGFASADDREWNDIRALDLKQLERFSTMQ